VHQRFLQVNGNEVRRLRRERAWTQRDLAKRAGCNMKTVENAENCKRAHPRTIGELA
jgi:transcriptional regulator with XRE-family HTH domain